MTVRHYQTLLEEAEMVELCNLIADKTGERRVTHSDALAHTVQDFLERNKKKPAAGIETGKVEANKVEKPPASQPAPSLDGRYSRGVQTIDLSGD